MLSCMKNLAIKKRFLLVLFVYAAANVTAVSADIYKGTDSKGNVYFSDQPTSNSVEYTPHSISIVSSTKVKAQDKKEAEVEKFEYTKFDIVSPVASQVIRNESDLSISLQIAPPLNVGQGHNIWLLMDGKPVVKDSQIMSLQVGRVDRGAHQFQAQVKDADGKIVARTRSYR